MPRLTAEERQQREADRAEARAAAQEAKLSTIAIFIRETSDLPANEQLRQLSKEGMGMRKTEFLALRAQTLGIEQKPDREKYTPTKYKQPPEEGEPGGGGNGIPAWGEETPEGTPILSGVPVDEPDQGVIEFYVVE